jgi:hypothetical protein
VAGRQEAAVRERGQGCAVRIAGEAHPRGSAEWRGAGAAEQAAKSTGKRVTVADAVEVFLEDVKAGKSAKTHLARKRMLALFQESCSKQFLDQITEADCQQFIRLLRTEFALAPSFLHRLNQAVRKFDVLRKVIRAALE